MCQIVDILNRFFIWINVKVNLVVIRNRGGSNAM